MPSFMSCRISTHFPCGTHINKLKLKFLPCLLLQEITFWDEQEERAEEDVATGNRRASSDCAINANQQSQGEPAVPATTPSHTA